ncbi:MAG: fibronectin type III domain-containing protein [Spirochaetota bacterium]
MSCIKKYCSMVLLAFMVSHCVPYKKKSNNMFWMIPLALLGQGGSVNYTVGGSVDGIEDGKYLTLKSSSDATLNLVSNGSFTFNTNFSNQAEYSVSIEKQPTDQTCSIANNSGVVAGEHVSDVTISCSSNTVVPQQTALSVDFSDIDAKAGKIGGTLTVAKASDESNITSYSVYWSNSSGEKVSSTAIANLEKTGSDLTYGIATDTEIPSGATHFLVLTGNSAGEMGAGVTGTITDLVDTTIPTTGNFASSLVATTTLSLTWDRATDDSTSQTNLQYIVYQSTAANIDTVANAEANGTALNSLTSDLSRYDVIGLSPNTTYYFNVIVQDELGNKAVHTMLSATTLNNDAPVPGNSGSIVASNVTTTSTNLTWDPGSDNLTAQADLEYRVYQSVANTISSVANAEANGTALNAFTQGLTSYNVTSLLNSATYYFTVIVKDADGNKSVYQTATVQTLDGTAPVPGAAGAIAATNITGTSLTLNWTSANDDVTVQSDLQYIAYQSSSNNIATVANAEANGTPVNSYTSNITSLAVSSLASSTSYYFTIVVKDSVGNKSIYSTGIFATTDSVPPVVGNGGELIGTNYLNQSLTVNWEKASDQVASQSLLEYQVYYSTTNNISTIADAKGNGTALNTYTADIDNFNVSGLNADTVYYFTILVKDPSGNESIYTSTALSTAFSGTWSFVDGGTQLGLTQNASRGHIAVNPIYYDSKIYISYYFSGGDPNYNIGLLRFEGENESPLTTSFSELDYNSSNPASQPYSISFNNKLYTIWIESNSGDKVFLKSYNAANNTFTAIVNNGNGLNKNSNHAASYPSMIEFQGFLYLTWIENGNVLVALYNGDDSNPSWNFIDSGINGLNKLPNKALYPAPAFAVFQNNLYLTWSEGNASNIGQLRIAKYNGGTSWSFIDGDAANGLNMNTSYHAYNSKLIALNDKLYCIWQENTATGSQVRIAVFNNNESSPIWTNVDGNQAQVGLNWNGSNSYAYNPFPFVYKNKLYITWVENINDQVNEHVRVRYYNGNDANPVWSFVDGNGSNGLSQNTNKRSRLPRGFVVGDQMYIVWTENYSSAGSDWDQIRMVKGN